MLGDVATFADLFIQPAIALSRFLLQPFGYPDFDDGGGIRWILDWVNVSTVCAGEYVGLEEIDNGIWNVYFGPLKLGRFHERLMRIEDEYGRLKSLKV